MSDLSPLAKSLVDTVRPAHEPTDADRHRVAARIAGHLAAGATMLAATKVAAGAVSKSASALLAVKIAVPLILVAGTATYAVRQASTPERPVSDAVRRGFERPAPVPESMRSVAESEPAASPVPEPEPAPQQADPGVAVPKTSAKAGPNPQLVPTPEPRLPVSENTLHLELGLLRDARAALKRGNPAIALALLDDQQTRFPKGVLAEEAAVVRVDVLCALGRIADARSAADDFFVTWPKSPLASRVRSTCIEEE